MLDFAPALAPLQAAVTAARLRAASLLMTMTLTIAHRRLPAGRGRFMEIVLGGAG
jgi:hypothetical protein